MNGPVVGRLTGELTITFPGSASLSIGYVSLPLVAKVDPRATSGTNEIGISVGVDLKEVRDTVQAILNNSPVTP